MLVNIMKNHERLLDIQLCACGLLLRTLGQGGARRVGTVPPAQVGVGRGRGGPGTQRWLHGPLSGCAGPTPTRPSPPCHKHSWGPTLRQNKADPDAFTHSEGSTCLPAAAPSTPSSGANPGSFRRPAALVQDPAITVPKGSSIILVLLSVLRSHPEAQQLLVMVYSLLTIICSQGGSAPGRVPGRQCWPLLAPCMAFGLFPSLVLAFSQASRPSPFHVKRHCPSALLTPISEAPGLLRPPARQAGQPPGPRTPHTSHPLTGLGRVSSRKLGSEGAHSVGGRAE